MSIAPSIQDCVSDVLERHLAQRNISGAVAGVGVSEERVIVARGIANLNTGTQFTEDTGWLLGSVTKLLTATALMRLVEAGSVDLDEPVERYVPEFDLRDSDAADAITVRMLVNHTNGIDADELRPIGIRGRDACRSYTAHLPRMGVLFEPGTAVHYSNPGFVLAARAIEEIVGLPFERAMVHQVFGPVGMPTASLVQTDGLLRRTAIGAFAKADGTLRATSVFSLAESGAGCGATMIVTIDDMLAYGRMHLRGGIGADGTRVLSSEGVDAMRTPTFDMGLPQAPPIGLAWWIVPIAGTFALWHGGGSPGGTSSFSVLPEYDATIVSYAAGPGGPALNDALHSAVIEELTGNAIDLPFEVAPTSPDTAIFGEYASFQRRISLAPDARGIHVTERFEPYDEDHRHNRATMSGGAMVPAPSTYDAVAPGQFAPDGVEPSSLAGFYGRLRLLASVPATKGRRAGIHRELRYLPKVA